MKKLFNFRLLVLIGVLIMSINTAWANYAYLDLTGFTSWYDGSAAFRLDKNGGGNVDSYSEIGSTGVWRFNIGDYSGSVTFKRMNSTRSEQWNYYNGSISSSQNVARISDWNSGSMQTSFVINYIHGTNQVYFDNSVSGFTNNIFLVVGHDYSPSGSSSTYSTVYKMTQVAGTKLYHVELSATWEDATYFAVIGSSSSEATINTNHNWGSSSLSSKGSTGGYTAAYKSVYNMEGGTYLITTATAGNNKAMTITYYDGYSYLPKVNATQAAKKRDTGTTYSKITGSNSWPATLKLRGSYMKNATDTARSVISSTAANDAESKRVYGVIKTGTVTHSYTSLSASYYFEGWGEDVAAPTETSATYSYQITSATTKYAFFSKKYTLSYDLKGTYGTSSLAVSVADFSGTKTSGSSIPTGHTITFTNTPATGYEIVGWYSDASCSTAYTSGTGGVTISADKKTFTLASLNANAGVYCKMRAKTYAITFDGNDGSDGSATATYKSSTLTSITHSARASYDLNGYYTATSGGTKVVNADGTLVASAGSYTNSSSEWIYDDDVELHAQWTYNPTLYDVTFGVGTSYTSYGSLSAVNNSTSAAISSGDKIISGTSVTFTASPNTGYVVEGWYTDAACTEDKHDAGETTYTTSITGATDVYVKYVEKTWSVAFAAGTGGTVTTPAATPQTVGQVTGISIAATPGTGYTFNRWTSSSGGSFTSAVTTNSNTFKPTANTTVTASFNETMSSLSTSCHYDAGNPSYAAPSVSGGATNVGYGTTRTITATAAGTGYTFAGWTLTNCTRTDGGSATATSITIRSNGDGAAATVVANYNEDLSSPWTLKGGTNLTGNNWTTAYNLTKKSGHSTESVAYYTLSISSTNSGVDGEADDWSFKLINSGTWYGLTADGSWWWQRSTGANKPLNTSGENIQICADVAGNYEVKVDYSTPASPTVTVIFPTSYTLTYSIGDVNGTNGSISTSPSTASGSKVLEGSSITLTAPAAKTGYTWKGWYTNAAGTEGKIADENRAITVTMNADKTLYACYTEDKYTVAFNNGDHGTVSPSGDQQVGIEGKSITATPATGWKFVNWSKTGAGVSLSSTTTNPTTVTASSAGSVTPNYAHRFVLRGSIKAAGDPAGGMAGWSANDNSSYASATISDGVMTITANLTKAKTQYKCMIRDLVTNSYKGLSTSADIGSDSPQTLSGSSDFWFTTTCAGTYTFTYNVAANTLKVVFPTSYTITYGVNGTGGTASATVGGETVGTSPGKAEAGSTVRFTATPSSGYQFTKWVDGSSTQLSTNNPYDIASLAADKTVKAVFTPITYNSGVLKKNGGSADGSYSVTYNATSITPSAPTKTGYHVDGYYAEAGTSTHIATAAGVLQNNKSGYTDATGHWNYAGVKDLYAKWAANTYTAENNIDGDGGSNGKYTATYDATSIVINTAPTKTGYNLTGYHAYGRGANTLATTAGALNASQSENKTGGKTLTNSSSQWIYDGTDATIYADWSPKTYDITLDREGGATGSTSVTMTYDASTHTAITNPTKTGYTFAGYWTGDNGTGTLVIATDGTLQANVSTYTGAGGIWKKDATCTLYAKWTPNNYTVTLSASGETGYGSAGSKDEVNATYDATMPTMGAAPTPAPGYKFQGYFTDHNGSGTKYYNADGSSARTWNVASATTLYAYFQKTVIGSLDHPAAVAKGDEIYVVVNPVFNQEGAQDYMAICWSLLYDTDTPVDGEHWSIESYTEGGTKQNQVRFTLTGMASGYYKIQAVLKANASSSFDPCSTGTELSTIKSNLRIAGNSTVTIQYKDASGNTIRENSSVEVARGDSIGIKAPIIIGYTFNEWQKGDVLSVSCDNSANCGLDKDSINIKAEYDGILIAKYNRKNTIYFKNTLNWPAVYVNLLSSGFWNDNGSGNSGHTNCNIAMTRLGESDVWYYEYGETSTSDYVSFTSQPQANATNFWGKDTDPKVMVVYPTRPNYDANERTAYGFHVKTPMFVPLAGQTAVEKNINNNGRAYYYNQGYWVKYEPISKETGYTLMIFNKKNNAATPDAGQAPVVVKTVPFVFEGDMTLPTSVTVDLEAGKYYGFKLYRNKGNTGDALSWYGNAGNMSNKHSGDFSKGETAWEFKTTQTSNCGLQTSSAGDYVFTLAYGKEASKDSMQFLIGVHYPEAGGDYRLVYSDNNRTGILSTTIPYNSEADTLSFFVDMSASPKLALQKCEVSYNGAETTTVTWTDTIADLFSGGLPAAITKSGVYYFCINRNADGKKELGDTKLYEGNFYIRTDGATPSKWDNFRQNNHLMAYSDYADANENFTHSYTQWYDLTNRKNLKFTVANDYSVSISDTLTREALEGQWTNIDDYIDENGDLNRQANVRFMYNEKTNAISRAYIDGAYADGGNFLKILSRTQDSIYAAAEGGAPVTDVTFIDDGNWLYEKTVYAQPGARYKLRSLFGETGGGKEIITQYFKGGEGSTAADSATMIGGQGSSRMQIRLIYDFKTNRVVTAYQPSGTIDANLEINADIMFMREHQGNIDQITFGSGKSISKIENIYCGLRFNKWTLNNKSKEEGHATLSPLLSRYERDIFYVSFPYDVNLSDVIGFGTYGQHWIVEYYDGAERAEKGFWKDTETFWKFVTPSMKDTFTLKAGTGYIVALDLDELWYIDDGAGNHASIWDNRDITNLELLFPGKVSSISDIDVTYNMPTHQCTINRGTTAGDRRIKDSHWNVLGVPTFKNITGAETVDGGGSGAIVFANTAWIKDTMNLKFIYDGNLADNSLTPKAVKGFEFQAMHAYVVQYCGNVTFTTSATPAPSPIVARRTYAEKPIDVDFRLVLNKNGVMEDQTFISLSNDENASAGFAFGEDLSKEFNNSRANIYTFIGTEWAAGNTLPMSEQTTVVPVGVKIASTGDYTFAIPEGTNGVGVTLIDNETGIRTSLSALDYTINLSAGTYDNRFMLEISPVHQSPTDIETISDEGLEIRGVRKVLIDNILYIVKDGVMYDARGSRVQ